MDGARVVLNREPDFAEILITGAFVGLPCLNENPPAVCKRARIENTGSDGRFTFEVKGRDTQTSTGGASTMGLSTKLPRGTGESEGPAVSYRFQVQTEQMDVPLGLWEPALEATADHLRARVSWTEIPPSILPADANLGSVSSSLRFEKGSQLVWMFLNASNGFEFDSRLLEDTTGTFAVYADFDDVDVSAAEGTKWDIFFRSARLPYRSPAGRPVSRGAACSAYGPSGQPVAQSPCRLTDGGFSEPFDARTDPACPPGQQCPQGSNNAAHIDLASAKNVTLVVIRGCSRICTLEASLDATNWGLIGSGQGSDEISEGSDNFAVTPAAPVPARFIRISQEGGIDELTEVSVWDDSPPAQAPAPAGSLLAPGDAPTGPEDGAERGRLLWIALAVVLVAAIAISVYLITRRGPA